MRPGTPDYLIIRYLHTRWALGDRRCQTWQLRRFREHGGHVDNTRWGRVWGIARQLRAAQARDRLVAPALVPGTERCRWWLDHRHRCPEPAQRKGRLCPTHEQAARAIHPDRRTL